VVAGAGLRLKVLVLVAVVTFGLGYLAQRWWAIRGGGLVPSSPMSLVLLGFMGAGVFAAGLPIRRMQRDRTRPPVNPLRALRTLVLAQACALTGALVAGWYAAQAALLAPDADASSVRERLILAGLLALAGVGLAAIGLWVQSVCRIDPPDADGLDDGFEEGLPEPEAY
jgi:hypothetical protein